MCSAFCDTRIFTIKLSLNCFVDKSFKGSLHKCSNSIKRIALRMGGWGFGHYVWLGGGLVITYGWVVVWSLRMGGWWFGRRILWGNK